MHILRFISVYLSPYNHVIKLVLSLESWLQYQYSKSLVFFRLKLKMKIEVKIVIIQRYIDIIRNLMKTRVEIIFRSDNLWTILSTKCQNLLT